MEDKPKYQRRKPKERHIIGLVIPHDFIFELLFRDEGDNRIYIPDLEGIPSGAKVNYVYHMFEREAFVFVLEHPSFPVCYEGDVMEIRNLEIVVKTPDPKKEMV